MTVKADLETLYSAAIAALSGGDYDTAISKAMACQLLIGTATESELNGMAIAWKNGAQIDGFIAGCRKLQAAALHTSAGGIQMSKVTYARVDDSGSYS